MKDLEWIVSKIQSYIKTRHNCICNKLCIGVINNEKNIVQGYMIKINHDVYFFNSDMALHNKYGPAVVSAKNFKREYWINGKEYSYSQFIKIAVDKNFPENFDKKDLEVENKIIEIDNIKYKLTKI